MPIECFFLDVGQGTSQVILLGDRRAIVIDGGPSAEIPLPFLDRYVDTIEALIVSHNDADHQRGAAQILLEYRDAIKHLHFLEDRPLDGIGIYRLAKEMLLHKSIIRLERNENYHLLYEDKTADLYLELLFPTYVDNLEARSAGDSNSTSAVLALHCGTRRIVFSADATITAWKSINHRLGGPSPSDIFVVPHHGGIVWSRQQGGESAPQYENRVRQDLRWLYTSAFPADFAVVSVGTSNPYDHPRQWVVEELRRANSTVLCTQITSQCAADLEQVRVLGAREVCQPCRSTKVRDQKDGVSRNVACAGTVLATLGPNEVVIRGVKDHQDWVDDLARTSFGQPLCRR